MSSQQNKDRTSTLAELLKDKPKRGRPPHSVSRQNVYVAISAEEKQEINRLAELLPENFSRADLPDLAIAILTARLESLHRAVADRNREIPEGVTDLESIYLLWDLSVPEKSPERKWTSIRVSPQEVIELGRAHGTLNAAFGANRSETFSLALVLLANYLETRNFADVKTLAEARKRILGNYL
ncbi:MAG: hypothetical protein KBE23_22115 [Chloroflexi bacterium]|nr:hypothetical protein [Chloroflexota bacterium]MBP7045462.1 hypothetical protein [Chloroflexota bacterium]